MAQNTVCCYSFFLLSRQFDSFGRFVVRVCNKLLCSSIGVMSLFVIIPVQKFLITLHFVFFIFFFISLFAFFPLLLIFFRDEIPLSNKREKFTFLSFKSLLLFISNNRLKSKKKKNTPTDVINLSGYL